MSTPKFTDHFTLRQVVRMPGGIASANMSTSGNQKKTMVKPGIARSPIVKSEIKSGNAEAITDRSTGPSTKIPSLVEEEKYTLMSYYANQLRHVLLSAEASPYLMHLQLKTVGYPEEYCGNYSSSEGDNLVDILDEIQLKLKKNGITTSNLGFDYLVKISLDL